MSESKSEMKRKNVMSGLPIGFECPENMRGHLAKVFAGEYDVPLDVSRDMALLVLDIGANCGAFSVWVTNRWPGAKVFAYEPMPDTFKYLEKNVMGLSVLANRAAVTGNEPGEAKIFVGKNNCGEASLFQCAARTEEFVVVPTIPPKDLPHAHILKLDCEGAELEILHSLIAVEGRKFSVIMLEYHSNAIRRMLDALLCDYMLVRADIANEQRGTFCYIHKELAQL